MSRLAKHPIRKLTCTDIAKAELDVKQEPAPFGQQDLRESIKIRHGKWLQPAGRLKSEVG
jgi:hypothetical protein